MFLVHCLLGLSFDTVFPLGSIFGDSKSCLSGLNLSRSEKSVSFRHFLVGGGDIRYWLEITSFWFVMVL